MCTAAGRLRWKVTEVSNFVYDYCVRKKSETLELERTTYEPNVWKYESLNLSLSYGPAWPVQE
jgi:hypothetical protein